MSISSERLIHLRKYHQYTLEELAQRAAIREADLIDIERGEKPLSAADARDLSHFLGADASYLLGEEKAYYLAWIRIQYLYAEQQLKPCDVFEQVYLPHGHDVYQLMAVINNTHDSEFGDAYDKIMILDDEDGDGRYLIKKAGETLEATKKEGVMYRHGQVIENYEIYKKVISVTYNLEDLLRHITQAIKLGKINIEEV